MKIKDLKRLIFAIVICESAGAIGSLFTFPSISSWYSTLNKPLLSPPNFIFGPVWTTLYALMGISLYLIWISNKQNKEALNLFWIHLFFNALWSFTFFGLKNPFLGFINIVILWLMIVLVINKFWKIKKEAGLILLPYFVWVSFATYLNFAIWYLN